LERSVLFPNGLDIMNTELIRHHSSPSSASRSTAIHAE
jgi:hypothetical protein